MQYYQPNVPDGTWKSRRIFKCDSLHYSKETVIKQ